MIPCEESTDWTTIIGAIGAVLTSLLAAYLVHRRIIAKVGSRSRASEGVQDSDEPANVNGSKASDGKDARPTRSKNTKATTNNP